MRRTPLFLALFGAVVAILALSTSAAAAGKAVGQTKSTHVSQTAPATTSKAHPSNSASGKHSSSGHSSGSSKSSGSTAAGNKFSCPQPDQDVPGASCDPSAKSGHDTDNGKGNDCDPGYGGSNPKGTGPDHGNDNRYPTSSESEVPGCGTVSPVQGGGGGGCTTQCSPCTTNCAPPPPCTTCGHGGSELPATGGVLGATGFGGGVAGATGVALANTGLHTLGLALLALLLLALGFFLVRRRGAAPAA